MPCQTPEKMGSSKFNFDGVKVEKTWMVVWQRSVGGQGQAIATTATEKQPGAPTALIQGSPQPHNGSALQK